MYHTCYLIFKNIFFMINCIFNHDIPFIICWCVMYLSDIFNTVNKHFIIKRLHNIICCPLIKCILCDILHSNCTYDDKCRRDTCLVVSDSLHDTYPIQLWHDNIKKNHIRRSIFYYIYCFFSISSRSNHCHVRLIINNFFYNVYHFFVIIRYNYL